MRTTSVFVLLAFALACGGKSKEPAHPTGESAEPAESGPNSEIKESESAGSLSGQSEEQSPAGSSDAGSAEAPEAVGVACQHMCASVEKKCGAPKGKQCRLSCDQYETAPSACAGVTAKALRCAAKAPDLLCADMAPDSCMVDFRAYDKCAKSGGTELPQEPGKNLPPGWARLKDPKGGFSVVMPKGAQLTEHGRERMWTVAAGGADYRAGSMPAPPGGSADKRIRAGALAFLGQCDKKLRIHGRVDKPDRVGVQMEASCPDGSGWRAFLWLKGDLLYVAAVKAPSGQNANADALIFSMEFPGG
ncbi:MAG TPA: hypothetical protein VGJ84_11560 [Polyangiaceae bacterium]|jgi:hypothetical protein